MSLQNVLQRCLSDFRLRHLLDICKMSWYEIFKTSCRCIFADWVTLLEMAVPWITKNSMKSSINLTKSVLFGDSFLTIWKVLKTAIKNSYVGVLLLKKHTILNKKFCNIDLNNLSFFMYKKHECAVAICNKRHIL